MRQRSLNGVLMAAVGVVFCLLAATAYSQLKEAESRLACVSQSHGAGKAADGCENCPATSCGGGQRRQAFTAARRPGETTERQSTGS